MCLRICNIAERLAELAGTEDLDVTDFVAKEQPLLGKRFRFAEIRSPNKGEDLLIDCARFIRCGAKRRTNGRNMKCCDNHQKEG